MPTRSSVSAGFATEPFLDATDLPSGIVTVEAWSRVQWIEKTLPVWAKLCDPVAARVVASMGAVLPEEVQVGTVIRYVLPTVGLRGRF